MKKSIVAAVLAMGLVGAQTAKAEVTFYVLGGVGYANVNSEIKGVENSPGFPIVREKNENSGANFSFGGGLSLNNAVSFELNRVAFGDKSEGVEYDGYSIGVQLRQPFNEHLAMISRIDYYKMDYQFANGRGGDGNGVGIGFGLRYDIPNSPIFAQGTYKYIRQESDVDGLARGSLQTIIHYPTAEVGYRF